MNQLMATTTLRSILEAEGLRYLQYTMLIACTEGHCPLVFAATKVDVKADATEIHIKAFGLENYELMRKGFRSQCWLLDHLVKEEVYIGCFDVEAIQENFFDIWTLGQGYNSIGINGLATKVKENNE